MNLTRKQDFAFANTGKTSDVTPLVNPHNDLLHMFFTVPEQLNSKWATPAHPGPSIAQKFPCFGRLAGHERVAILIDDIHNDRHALSSPFRVRAPRDCSMRLS